MPTFWSMRCYNKRALSPVVITLKGVALLLLFVNAARAIIIVGAPEFHSSIKAAIEAAAADQSAVLVLFAADWAEPSNELKSKTLRSKEFSEQAGLLHLAEVDVDSQESTARAYGVNTVPTLVLMTPDNKIVARHMGFVHTAELLLWLREARDRIKEGKWEGTVPGSKLNEFTEKAAAARLGSND